MEIIRISEAEALRDPAAALALVSTGTEVVIERELKPAVIMQVASEKNSSIFLRLTQERDSAIEDHTLRLNRP